MGDSCKTITVIVDIQENGLIRSETGLLIGRLFEDVTMEGISKKLEKKRLNILFNGTGSKL